MESLLYRKAFDIKIISKNNTNLVNVSNNIKSNSTDGSLDWTIKDHQANAQVENLKWQWGGRVVSYAGGSQQHNNMPPYLAVFMWKRIA